jgi:hypothetical protein
LFAATATLATQSEVLMPPQFVGFLMAWVGMMVGSLIPAQRRV